MAMWTDRRGHTQLYLLLLAVLMALVVLLVWGDAKALSALVA